LKRLKNDKVNELHKTPRTLEKNPIYPHINLHLHQHNLQRTRKNPHPRKLCTLKTNLHIRRHQTRQRSPHHRPRPHLQLQSHNLPPSQHSRPKKQTRRNPRLHPKQLEILGDGTQTKSYLYINDCTKAILLGLEKSKKQIEIYNVGSEDQVDVKTIAQTVIEEMKLKNVKLKFAGGVDGGRGWKGDVKNMLLDISKLKSLGWKPKLNSEQAIREATRQLLNEMRS